MNIHTENLETENFTERTLIQAKTTLVNKLYFEKGERRQASQIACTRQLLKGYRKVLMVMFT